MFLDGLAVFVAVFVRIENNGKEIWVLEQKSIQNSYLIILLLIRMGSSSGKVDKQAQKRIKESKFKGKLLQYANLYGNQTKKLVTDWADKNMVDDYQSVTYTSYAYPSYRKSKQEWIDAVVKAHENDWSMSIIQFTDAKVVNNTELISLIYKFMCMKDGKQIQVYFELDAIFDMTSGKWKKSVYKQYGSKNPLRYADYVAPTYSSSSRYDTQPSYSSNTSYNTSSYNTSSTNNYDRDRENRQRQQRQRKDREDRERRDRESRQAYARQQRQAAERQARYQQQQRQHRQNMRRQEQAQAEYRRQQQQAAQQRHRQAQQAMMKYNNSRY